MNKKLSFLFLPLILAMTACNPTQTITSSTGEESKTSETTTSHTSSVDYSDAEIKILNKDAFSNLNQYNVFPINLDIQFSPSTATYSIISSNQDVAIIEDQNVLIKGVGKTTIEVFINENKNAKDSFEFEVIKDETIVTKIKDVKEVGKPYTVEGILVANDLKNKCALVDDTGTLAIYDTLAIQALTLEVGKEYRFTGVLEEYLGLKELGEVGFMNVSEINRYFPKMEPKQLNKDDIEKYDGIHAMYCSFEATVKLTEKHINYNYVLTDKKYGGFTCLDINDYGLFSAKDGDKISLVGVLFGKATFDENNAHNFLISSCEFIK